MPPCSVSNATTTIRNGASPSTPPAGGATFRCRPGRASNRPGPTWLSEPRLGPHKLRRISGPVPATWLVAAKSLAVASDGSVTGRGRGARATPGGPALTAFSMPRARGCRRRDHHGGTAAPAARSDRRTRRSAGDGGRGVTGRRRSRPARRLGTASRPERASVPDDVRPGQRSSRATRATARLKLFVQRFAVPLDVQNEPLDEHERCDLGGSSKPVAPLIQ
jgi:hypothetical protein